MEGEAVVPGPDGCLDPPVPDEADPVEQLVTQGLSEPAHHEVAEAQANGEDQPDGPDMHPAAGPEPSSADGQPEVGYSELLEGMRNAAAITEAPSTQDDTPSNTGAAPVDGEQTTAQQSEVEQEAADQPQAEEGAKKRRRSRFGPAVGSEPDKPAEANSAKKESKATEDGATGEGGDTADEKPRKRRSRWTDKEPEKPLAIVNVKDSKEVITKFPKDITLPGGIKVKMPATVTGEQPHVNPEIRKCYEELAKISRKLLLNEYDMPPEGDPNRSPSPTPVYDKNGVRLNTREVRYREKMMDRRTDLIEELMSMDPEYRPPPDYRPRKIHRKVFIPQKDNPGCNYIGLIIGPRGNTQQRMQRETNCKIAIRGRGSLKEGAPRDPKFDYGEDEDLHVLITGDRKEDVDRAVAEIEDLLQPMDEARLEQKRLQLRELAALNGTLKDEQACFKCGELGHRAYECPQNQMELYQLPEQLQHKVDALYQRDVARVHGVDVGNADDEYKSFLAELGGDRPQDGPEARPSGPGSFRGASGGGMGDGGRFSGGGGGRSFRGDDVPDECKLYVGNLPHAVNDGTLRSMFEPFGTVLSASVVLEQGTGQSRGFGFVHMTDVDVVMAAAAAMNGKVVDGRPLSVRQKSSGPPPPRARFSGGMREPEDCKVYATYLPQSVTESELASLFSRYGSVTSCNHITDRTTGESKGYAFIVMSSPGEAMAAVKGLNGHNMDGRDITVRLAAERPGGPGSRGMPPAGPGGGRGRPGLGYAPPPGRGGFRPGGYDGGPDHGGGHDAPEPPPGAGGYGDGMRQMPMHPHTQPGMHPRPPYGAGLPPPYGMPPYGGPPGSRDMPPHDGSHPPPYGHPYAPAMPPHGAPPMPGYSPMPPYGPGPPPPSAPSPYGGMPPPAGSPHSPYPGMPYAAPGYHPPTPGGPGAEAYPPTGHGYPPAASPGSYMPPYGYSHPGMGPPPPAAPPPAAPPPGDYSAPGMPPPPRGYAAAPPAPNTGASAAGSSGGGSGDVPPPPPAPTGAPPPAPAAPPPPPPPPGGASVENEYEKFMSEIGG